MTKLEQEKFDTLMKSEGFTDEIEFLQEAMSDSLSCNAICMNEGCDYTVEMEGDQDQGWCDECSTNSVKSALILKGLI